VTRPRTIPQVIEDKTFGLKNKNKSKVVQQFVAQVCACSIFVQSRIVCVCVCVCVCARALGEAPQSLAPPTGGVSAPPVGGNRGVATAVTPRRSVVYPHAELGVGRPTPRSASVVSWASPASRVRGNHGDWEIRVRVYWHHSAVPRGDSTDRAAFVRAEVDCST